jgi:FkbH-like protein
MASPEHTVYALNVSDRFGDAGLTGVLILHWEGAAARVEAFFMSCRVIGRGIESAIWGVILADASRAGCRTLAAEYRPTSKNALVATFFDELGLHLTEAAPDGVRRYQVDLDALVPPQTHWVEVSDVG